MAQPAVVIPFDDLLTVAHLADDWPIPYATKLTWIFRKPQRATQQPKHHTRCGLSLTDRPWITWPHPLPLCASCTGRDETPDLFDHNPEGATA